MNNVLVIGSGGREHCICWKLSQSPDVKRIFVSPGSHGIGSLPKVENVSLDIKNFKQLCQWAKTQAVEMVVVGPEDPLAAGIADSLKEAGVLCFGPTAAAARIEADKNWAKQFMVRHNIPTARYESFTSPVEAKEWIKDVEYDALVVKASGLAAGKGVVVAANKIEVYEAIDMMLKDQKLGAAGATVVIEELLEGEEVSVLGFCDGNTVRVMLPAQDHKRVFNGDEGPNTGGMGAYCPCPLITDEQLRWVERGVLQKAVDGLKKEGIPFVGVLYAGLMMTKDGPKVLEFNCRFGDPETQVILPLLESDLYTVMKACCKGTLGSINLQWKEGMTAVGVVMSSRGYPESSSKGDHITGLEDVVKEPGILVFHSGVAKKDERLVTNGGRVLINVCLSPTLITAAAKATLACSTVKFPGAHFRTDIAHKGIPKWILTHGKLSYKISGVDIKAGDDLVGAIKPSAGSTSRNGVLTSLGGFGALFDTKLAGYMNPILVSGTDGVGTKLKVAHMSKIHSTVGIDLVAMCVNDILCHGAEPLFFLDYFACGKLEVGTASQVVDAVARGCRLSGCALVGGETAEMPGLYKEGDYDLAGFAVGAVEKGEELPLIDQLKEGDSVIALPSSGLHSNGFSLVRKVMDSLNMAYTDKSPFSDQTIGEALLTPTRIYVKEVLPLVREKQVKALAHITGGGLTENIPRVLKEDLKVSLSAKAWKIPPVFPWLAASGNIKEDEMLRTFNCGVGMVLIVSQENTQQVLSTEPSSILIGKVTRRERGEKQVSVPDFADAMAPLMKPFVSRIIKKAASVKRIGVLISGTGSNLQALIDAIQLGNIDGEIVVVISNKPGVEGLNKAKRAGIRSVVIPHGNYKSREEFEEDVHKELVSSGVEILVLAGFMRVLTGCFVSKWRGRLINLHPSLLPLFKGAHAVKEALAARVLVTGCSVHFVEEGVDTGAVIVQQAVPVLPSDTEDTLSQRIHKAEHTALPKAVQLLCTGQVRLDLETGLAVWK